MNNKIKKLLCAAVLLSGAFVSLSYFGNSIDVQTITAIATIAGLVGVTRFEEYIGEKFDNNV